MIPQTTQSPVIATISQANLPSQTYRVNWETGRVQGRVDGREAMVQAMEKILRTVRYRHLIYSWQYGLDDISTTTDTSALQLALSQALCQDARILAVSNLVAKQTARGTWQLTFDVETIFGNLKQEVNTLDV